MKNNNGASIRKLSNRSLKNNRMRNIFAVLAIVLTSILFTAIFSLVSGAIQVTQESTMREVGAKSHAGLKGATAKQYEKVVADPMVKRSSYNILIGIADNIRKRQAELRYTPDESILQDMFITLEEGSMPAAENEIVADTFILDELGLPYALGEKVLLRFDFMGRTVEGEFVVSGWYQGDPIAHASELFLSEGYWNRLKKDLTDEDFLKWGEEHPQDRGVGLRAVNLFFDNALSIDRKVRTVIENAGYEPETELDYGVNWAYMDNRVESSDPLTLLVLFAAVAVVLVTGYLIIYNIFQISVINDIRFYGLLKTIGTTKRQIKKLVKRQAAILSLIGIPFGLIIGYGVGRLALPFMLSFSDIQGMEVSLHFQPWILVFGAGFSALTVFLSSRKPGKIAGSVSPIEAVNYTEAAGGSKVSPRKRRRKHNGRNQFNAFSMAISNLGRNKRTAGVVIMAVSFSLILLATIMTAVGSFRIDQFIEQRIVGDFLLGSVSVTGAARSGDIFIEPEFLALADRQENVLDRQEMWTRFACFVQVDDQALERLRKLNAEGKLGQDDPYEAKKLETLLRGERSFNGWFYGYSEGLFSHLTVMEGNLDVEKFLTGDYVLLTQVLGEDFLSPEEHVYHPGDTVTVEMVTQDSITHEITDASGETVDVWYENLKEKEYEVMAIVDIPYSMGLNRYTRNGFDVVLPLEEFASDEYSRCFAVSYEVEQEGQAAFESAVKSYTETHTQMGYVSQDSLRGEFENMVFVIAAIGIALAAVIALIGILNFINAITTSVIARKREFAMLQSIGMTNGQLLKTLVFEGIGYVAVSGVVSFVVGSLLSWLVLHALNHMLLFFEYRFQILPFVIMLPLLLAVSVLAPYFAYRNVRKKSVVERLREDG